MEWIKEGFICSKETLNLDWYKKNTMVPLPYLKNKDCLRIFVTMCDEKNIGRIGYVDVNPSNPKEIIGYSKTPVIDIGEDGKFDDNGVVTASLFKEDNKLYMFYSGYQLSVKVPYFIFTGLAVSEDNGDTFKKISIDVPILDRIPGEINTRCVPFVIKENGVYKMWYTADFGSGWIDGNKKKVPLYDLKYLESTSITDWSRENGQTVISCKDNDEHGIAKCTLWKENGLYKIIYSIRSISQGYRLGYAESADGKNFERNDKKVGIDVSSSGWDSEMVAFAERIEIDENTTYLFYCGNHYGMAGIGYAKLHDLKD
ncbi:hypothetical protein NG782_10130 [Aliarcobacter cryaerophilus]|uniref:hypothetical protein n=1 Tax=Aliarcobacter cryaerophilus TaxID=28198 RepID=UPI003DA504FD